MAKRDISEHAKKAMVAAFEVAPYAAAAAKAAGVSRTCHYRWMKDDPAYATAIEEAKRVAIERWEKEVERRAFEGLRRKKFDKGGKPIIDPETMEQYEEREFSDTLAIFVLKAANPEKYRERTEQHHSGEVVHRIEVVRVAAPPMADMRRLPTGGGNGANPA